MKRTAQGNAATRRILDHIATTRDTYTEDPRSRSWVGTAIALLQIAQDKLAPSMATKDQLLTTLREIRNALIAAAAQTVVATELIDESIANIEAPLPDHALFNTIPPMPPGEPEPKTPPTRVRRYSDYAYNNATGRLEETARRLEETRPETQPTPDLVPHMPSGLSAHEQHLWKDHFDTKESILPLAEIEAFHARAYSPIETYQPTPEELETFARPVSDYHIKSLNGAVTIATINSNLGWEQYLNYLEKRPNMPIHCERRHHGKPPAYPSDVTSTWCQIGPTPMGMNGFPEPPYMGYGHTFNIVQVPKAVVPEETTIPRSQQEQEFIAFLDENFADKGYAILPVNLAYVEQQALNRWLDNYNTKSSKRDPQELAQIARKALTTLADLQAMSDETYEMLKNSVLTPENHRGNVKDAI